MSRHVNRAFLRSLMNDEVSAEDATRVLLDHLSQECPECRQALVEEAEAMELEDLHGQPRLPGTILLRVLEKGRAKRERGARSLTDRLIAAGDRAPQMVREGDVEEYANPVLAQILLSRTWEACKRRQPNAKALALATFEVGRKLSQVRPFFELSFDYRFAGLSLAANAERIADRLEAAFSLLQEAEKLLFEMADSGLESDFHRIRGRTCLDAGLLDEAEASIIRAAECAAECGDCLRMAQVHLLLADVRRERSDSRGRIKALEAAAKFLEDSNFGQQEQLRFAVHVNLAVAWAELGDATKAHSELKHIDPKMFLEFGQEGKLHWIRGLVAKARKDYAEAVVELRQAQELFESKEFHLEAGLVILDLAAIGLLAANKGLLSDVVRDLGELSEKAADLGVATQLYMCCLAVQNDALTLELIQDLYHRLNRGCSNLRRI